VREQYISQIKFFVRDKNITDLVEVERSIPKIGEIKKICYESLDGLKCEILNVNNMNKIIIRIDSLQQNITATLPSSYFSEPVLN